MGEVDVCRQQPSSASGWHSALSLVIRSSSVAIVIRLVIMVVVVAAFVVVVVGSVNLLPHPHTPPFVRYKLGQTSPIDPSDVTEREVDLADTDEQQRFRGMMGGGGGGVLCPHTYTPPPLGPEPA